MSADPSAAYRRGFLASLPFIAMIAPFGLLFGVVATGQGLSMFETMAFTVMVIAGAAQFVALQLMQEGAPVLVTILTAAAVNLRMAMYSVSITPYLGAASLWQRMAIAYCLVDQSYVVGVAEFARQPGWTLRERIAFYWGVVSPIVPVWYASTWVGAAFGKAIPKDVPLDFIVPITFLAMVAPLLLTRAQIAAAAVSVLVALVLWWMPYSTGLLVAGIAAMLTGALVEMWEERRHAAN